VIVVGGANSAGQAALHLATHAKHVTMLVRGESLSRAMSRYLVDRIEAHERITVRTGTHVSRAEGGDSLEQVVVTGPDGEASLDAGGMFVLIGGEPLTAGVEDWLGCDAGGYLMTGPARYAGGRPQLVAAGTRPSLPRIEPARAVRRGRRPSRLDQASRIGRRRRRNVDRAGAQLPSHSRRRSAVGLWDNRRSTRGERWHRWRFRRDCDSHGHRPSWRGSDAWKAQRLAAEHQTSCGEDDSETLSLSYVASRTIEATIIGVGAISLLSVVTLRDDLAASIGADGTSLDIAGQTLVAIHDWTFLLGPGFCVGVNGILLGWLMYRTGLMPPRLAMLGVIGGPLIFVSSIAVLFGAYEQDGLHALFSVPEGAFEAAFAIYLIVKGFRPSPVLASASTT
jgi:hypothetical protein